MYMAKKACHYCHRVLTKLTGLLYRNLLILVCKAARLWPLTFVNPINYAVTAAANLETEEYR